MDGYQIKFPGYVVHLTLKSNIWSSNLRVNLYLHKPFICTSESWVDQWLVSQCRVLERGQWPWETVALNLRGPVCRSSQSRLCCCRASTAGLWPWQEATCAQCFCWFEPRSWILWKIQFWGPFCINDGAIFLAAVDLVSDAPYIKVSSVQVGPSLWAGYLEVHFIVRKSTHLILCPLIPCSTRAAFSIRKSVIQFLEHSDFSLCPLVL